MVEEGIEKRDSKLWSSHLIAAPAAALVYGAALRAGFASRIVPWTGGAAPWLAGFGAALAAYVLVLLIARRALPGRRVVPGSIYLAVLAAAYPALLPEPDQWKPVDITFQRAEGDVLQKMSLNHEVRRAVPAAFGEETIYQLESIQRGLSFAVGLPRIPEARGKAVCAASLAGPAGVPEPVWKASLDLESSRWTDVSLATEPAPGPGKLWVKCAFAESADADAAPASHRYHVTTPRQTDNQ